jgi:hypothetical protein
MVVVVGGHSRNIGKTSVVVGLIRLLPEARWTAVKITQHGHGQVESTRPYDLREQVEPGDSDTGRFLAAGARRSYWLRTPVGQLGNAVAALRGILESSENAILESNSILAFVEPDLYLAVVDLSVSDVKSSSRRFLDRADAFVVNDGGSVAPFWKEIFAGRLERKPRFPISPPHYVSTELAQFVRDRLFPTR